MSPTALPGRDDRRQVLVTTIQQLSFARRPETVQATLSAAGRDLAQTAGALLVLREGDRCRHVDNDLLGPDWKDLSFPLVDSPCGSVILERTPLLVSDVKADPRLSDGPLRPGLGGALAVLPVRAINPVGAVGFYWDAKGEPSEDKLAVLQALADSAALALENVQMRNLVERRSRERASQLAAANLRLEAANLELEAANRRLAGEVAERRRAEEEVRRLSLTDELTGTANRRGFFLHGESHLENARSNGSACAVMFVDIDGLKRVNDALGHDAGSTMIRDAAALLRRTFGGDALIGRLGGDEFAVLATYPEPLESAALEAMVEAAVAKLNAEGQRPSPLSLSVGAMAERPGPLRSLDELLAAADGAMYERKRARGQPEPEPASRFRTPATTTAGE